MPISSFVSLVLLSSTVKMSIVCKEVKSEFNSKEVEEYITVQRTERPKNLPIAEKWCMEPCYILSTYERIAHDVENFEVRPDDVWVINYPKSGTTWTQEMVWQICNNMDYEGGKEKLTTRFPYLEIGGLRAPGVLPDEIERLNNMPSPRFIKCFLPAHILPPQIWTVNPKIVYLARNCKDVAISWYYHHIYYNQYKQSFSYFMEAFLNDMICQSPYHSHIIDFWNMRNEENILFLTFEEMKANHPAVIKKTAKFFGKNYYKEEIDTLADHLSFTKFSKNTACDLEFYLKMIEDALHIDKMPDHTYIITREGFVGSYKEEMSPELIARFDKWTESEMKKWKCDEELRKIFTL